MMMNVDGDDKKKEDRMKNEQNNWTNIKSEHQVI